MKTINKNHPIAELPRPKHNGVFSKAVARCAPHDDLLGINRSVNLLPLFGTTGLKGKFLLPYGNGDHALLNTANTFAIATALCAVLSVHFSPGMLLMALPVMSLGIFGFFKKNKESSNEEPAADNKTTENNNRDKISKVDFEALAKKVNKIVSAIAEEKANLRNGDPIDLSEISMEFMVKYGSAIKLQVEMLEIKFGKNPEHYKRAISMVKDWVEAGAVLRDAITSYLLEGKIASDDSILFQRKELQKAALELAKEISSLPDTDKVRLGNNVEALNFLGQVVALLKAKTAEDVAKTAKDVAKTAEVKADESSKDLGRLHAAFRKPANIPFTKD